MFAGLIVALFELSVACCGRHPFVYLPYFAGGVHLIHAQV